MRRHHQAGEFLLRAMVLLGGPLCLVVLLCPFSSQAFDYGGRIAKHVCVHGTWNEDRFACDCDHGWRSAQGTEPLTSPYHWCDYPVAVQPNKSTSEKTAQRVPLNPVAAGVVLLAVACFCGFCVLLSYCFRRRRRGRRSDAHGEEMEEQVWALQHRAVPNMPVPYPERVWAPTSSAPLYAMPAGMRTNPAMYSSMVSAPWNATTALGPAFYTDGSPCAHSRCCACMALWQQFLARAGPGSNEDTRHGCAAEPSSSEPQDVPRITAQKGDGGETQG